jgi:hypothetical protein
VRWIDRDLLPGEVVALGRGGAKSIEIVAEGAEKGRRLDRGEQWVQLINGSNWLKRSYAHEEGKNRADDHNFHTRSPCTDQSGLCILPSSQPMPSATIAVV